MSSTLWDHPQSNSRPRRERDSATRKPPRTPALNDGAAYPAVNAFGPSMDFRVDLAVFRGPLDLLLYLVRKHELDVTHVSVANITEQYISHLEVLHELDVDAVGDFVEVASLLIEIKSRLVLPHADEEDAECVADDPREELVQRLLEYKKYKDAASMLDESGHQWQRRYQRVANDLPPREVQPAEQPLREVELWDLVSAMGRIMRESDKLRPPSIVYDDTPIHVYMRQIHDRLAREQRISFTELFRPGMHKAQLIGVFLAVLELARHYGVFVEQAGLHSEMWLAQSGDFKPSLEVSEVFSDQFEDSLASPSKPRPR